MRADRYNRHTPEGHAYADDPARNEQGFAPRSAQPPTEEKLMTYEELKACFVKAGWEITGGENANA